MYYLACPSCKKKVLDDPNGFQCERCQKSYAGVILDVQPTGTLTTRDGQQRDKRTLTIGDESNVSIGLTLWGEACECQDWQVGQVAIFQACRVSDFNGKSLNGSSNPKDSTLTSKHPRFLKLT